MRWWPQILAAATYPDQIVEADRWLQQHTELKGEQLGQEVDKQPWDPSVKALAEFPSVLANMDKNLSWTLVARRCLRQPAARRNERGSGYARPCGEGGQLKEHIAREGEPAGPNYCDRTRRSGGCLRA